MRSEFIHLMINNARERSELENAPERFKNKYLTSNGFFGVRGWLQGTKFNRRQFHLNKRIFISFLMQYNNK